MSRWRIRATRRRTAYAGRMGGGHMDVLGYLLADDEHADGRAQGIPDPIWLGERMAGLYRRWDGPAEIDLAMIATGFLRHLNQLEAPIGQVCLQAAESVG